MLRTALYPRYMKDKQTNKQNQRKRKRNNSIINNNRVHHVCDF